MNSLMLYTAIDYGRILGRTLASCTDCLIIGESIPAGTTTALAVLKSLGIDAHVSSSMPKNPKSLKNGIVEKALERSDSKEPYDIIANAGDPMIPFVAGMLSTASEITKRNSSRRYSDGGSSCYSKINRI